MRCSAVRTIERADQEYLLETSKLADLMWTTSPINVSSWIPMYVETRYGGNVPAAALDAWEILSNSVYNCIVQLTSIGLSDRSHLSSLELISAKAPSSLLCSVGHPRLCFLCKQYGFTFTRFVINFAHRSYITIPSNCSQPVSWYAVFVNVNL